MYNKDACNNDEKTVGGYLREGICQYQMTRHYGLHAYVSVYLHAKQ